MRLTDEQCRVVREEAARIFGRNVTVRLFGSRIDDNVRGGDIDLLVESNERIPDRQRKTLQLVAKLQIRLGDQPIDVLALDPETVPQPVHEQARRTGVRL
jgi:predicted nucleotidyltransferase